MRIKILFFIKKIILFVLNKLYVYFLGVDFFTYHSTSSNRSFDSMSAILLWMLGEIGKKYNDFEICGKDIFEFGSGKFLSHPIALKFLGAHNIVSSDILNQFDPKAAKLSFKNRIMAKKFFSSLITSKSFNETCIKIEETDFDLHRLSNMGIDYIAPVKMEDCNENNRFDLVLSYTTLEHIPPHSISNVLSSSLNLLKVGSVFCHFIDLEDHADSRNNPFAFLSVSEWSDSDCFSRGNRLRPSDWKVIFNSFDNIEYDFTIILKRDAELLPPNVENIEDNYSSGILVIGRKIS